LPRELEVELAKTTTLDDASAFSVDSKWVGSWNCNDRQVENVVLTFDGKGRFLHGWLKLASRIDSQHFEVREQLTGIASRRRILLDGISSKVQPMNAGHEFSLDSFVLDLSDDAAKMSGQHNCQLGTGSVILKKVLRVFAYVAVETANLGSADVRATRHLILFIRLPHVVSFDELG